ncbi:unnamed protein product [Caenorhabditis auriculariae]|uniref:Transporter n=1 Tax=Caenorhabditis auriculariae TaxID=2777116 RepID=A0A8S1HP99_9PELO|nr:unnamed protein product [Caenorhabditis auriculariae]
MTERPFFSESRRRIFHHPHISEGDGKEEGLLEGEGTTSTGSPPAQQLHTLVMIDDADNGSEEPSGPLRGGDGSEKRLEWLLKRTEDERRKIDPLSSSPAQPLHTLVMIDDADNDSEEPSGPLRDRLKRSRFTAEPGPAAAPISLISLSSFRMKHFFSRRLFVFLALARMSGESSKYDTSITEKSVKKISIESDKNGSTEKDDSQERDQWDNQFEFLLTILGMSVGLGNIWRFPMRAYENGGSAFLIPYLTCAVLFGLPAMYLEAALGQYHRKTPPILFRRIAPILQGVGWMNVMIASLVAVYYILLIGWIAVYLVGVLTGHVDHWTHCHNSWNDAATCIDMSLQEKCAQNSTARTYFHGSCHGEESFEGKKMMVATEQYFMNYVVKPSTGFIDFNTINFKSLIGVVVCWLFTAFIVLKGAKYMGKASYVTVIMPYVLVVILFFRGITLEGASDGLYYYLGKPDFDKLFLIGTWSAALKQMCFSLSIGYGGMITLASYNKPKNNCFRDALVVVIGDTFMSLIGGAAVFSTLGFLAHQRGVGVPDVVQSGLSLAFVVYPEAMSHMPLPWLWSLLFFVMLFCLGISSEIVFVEIGCAAIHDQLPSLKNRKYVIVTIFCFVLFLLGIVMCTDGGYYWFVMFDEYAAGVSACLAITVETVVIAYIYRNKNQAKDMFEMLGPSKNFFTRIFGQHSFYFPLNWLVITPVLGSALVVLASKRDYPFEGDADKYPILFDILGWTVCLIPAFMMPIFAYVAYAQFKAENYDLRGLFMKQLQLPSYPRIYAEMDEEEMNKQKILPDREPWDSAPTGFTLPDSTDSGDIRLEVFTDSVHVPSI